MLPGALRFYLILLFVIFYFLFNRYFISSKWNLPHLSLNWCGVAALLCHAHDVCETLRQLSPSSWRSVKMFIGLYCAHVVSWSTACSAVFTCYMLHTHTRNRCVTVFAYNRESTGTIGDDLQLIYVQFIITFKIMEVRIKIEKVMMVE